MAPKSQNGGGLTSTASATKKKTTASSTPSTTKRGAAGAQKTATGKTAAKKTTTAGGKTKTTTTTTAPAAGSGLKPGAGDMAQFRRAGGTDLAMAEGGEMCSDAIVSVMNDRGTDEGDDEGASPQEPIETGEDPWGGKASRDEEWRAVVNEEAPKVVIEEDDVDGGSAVGYEVADILDAKLEASFAGEPPTPRAVVATDCGLAAFQLSAGARAAVVSLDVSGSKLGSLSSLVSGGWLWVRELKLSGNKIKGWPGGLAAMPALLALDLSYNPISLAGADLRPLAGLVRLELSGCNLSNLTGVEDDSAADSDAEEEEGGEGEGGGAAATPLAPLVSLRELNLTDNEFEAVAALAPLRALPSLRDLDLTDNEVRDVRGYKKSMLEMVPHLARLDGDGTGVGTSYTRGRLDYGDSGTATVFGANVDRSSCSCVEGNPCVDATLCLDWKGRYTVAMLARRRKGYYGEEGTSVQYNMF